MAKVNADKLVDHIKTRMEQRLTFWAASIERNINTSIKKELSEVKWWQFKKKRKAKDKLLTSYLQIETLKQVINEVRRLA